MKAKDIVNKNIPTVTICNDFANCATSISKLTDEKKLVLNAIKVIDYAETLPEILKLELSTNSCDGNNSFTLEPNGLLRLTVGVSVSQARELIEVDVLKLTLTEDSMDDVIKYIKLKRWEEATMAEHLQLIRQCYVNYIDAITVRIEVLNDNSLPELPELQD